jgi:nitrogen regulatory protein PII
MNLAKLVTIIAERVLETELTACLEAAGAPGYTVEEGVRGKGRHGSRGGQLESTRNIKILVLAPDPVATRILDEVKRKMAQGYALVAFMHEVHVVNPVSAQADTVSV